jgi:cystathionine beta-lyase/cystathionine gamma-synthase
VGSTPLPGDELVAHPVLYGCTHSLFETWYPAMGIQVARMDLNDLAALRAHVTDATRVLYLESPANPTLELIDIGALRELADEVNASRPPERRLLILVDNTFATPFGQRPLELGADVVLHSLTKNLGGFGTELGGAVILSREMLGRLLLYRKDFGGILGSKAAWAILVYGLPTLPLRLKRQQYTAQIVAEWLKAHPAVLRVAYPGLASFPQRELAERQMRDFDGDFAPGNMISFQFDPAQVDVIDFLDEIAREAYSLTLAVSLGHTKTLIESPATMTHSSYGPSQEGGGAVRISIGLESPADILTDLEAAIEAVRRRPVRRGASGAPAGRNGAAPGVTGSSGAPIAAGA